MSTEENFLDDGELHRRKAVEFKPTIGRPLPSFPCTQIMKDGERCPNQAIMGMRPDNAKCYSHGGNIPAVKEAAASRVEAARMQLFDHTELAVDTLYALMASGSSEAVKLKAATEVLDRTIGKAPIELEVSGEVTVSAKDEIARRLTGLLKTIDDVTDDIEDAEIVDEEDNQ